VSRFIIETVEIVNRTYAVEAESQDQATELFYDVLPDPIDEESSSEEFCNIYERKIA
jgi:hypothetical protein